MGSVCKELYKVVPFLWPYNVQKVKFSIQKLVQNQFFTVERLVRIGRKNYQLGLWRVSYVPYEWLKQGILWCRHCQKIEILICGTKKQTEQKYDYQGTPLLIFLSFSSSQRYIMYRRQAINQFSQRVGLGNSYCNCSAICRYVFCTRFFPIITF